MMKWTKPRLEALERAVARAMVNNQTDLIFAKRSYVVGYAKYLIKHLTITLQRCNRAQMAPHTDEWMQGDRYGDIVARRRDGSILVRLDKSQRLLWVAIEHISEEFVTV